MNLAGPYLSWPLFLIPIAEFSIQEVFQTAPAG